MRVHILVVGVLVGLCPADARQDNESLSVSYQVSGRFIMKDGVPHQFKGANAFFVYGGDSGSMAGWSFDIVRLPIMDLDRQPVTGAPQLIDGAWFHPLETIVQANRANGMVTILCPFAWHHNDPDSFFLGRNPSETSWYTQYKDRMRTIANHFKDQTDVWIDVWNEPYDWLDRNGYSHDMWLSDMADMLDNIRSTGATNIILVPGNATGQGDEAILAKGHELQATRSNLLFELHAYQRWQKDLTTASEVNAKIDRLHAEGFPLLFGELGVENANESLEVTHFLDAASDTGVSCVAWCWDSLDGNTLRIDGVETAWGDEFKAFCQEPRNVLVPHISLLDIPRSVVTGTRVEVTTYHVAADAPAMILVAFQDAAGTDLATTQQNVLADSYGSVTQTIVIPASLVSRNDYHFVVAFKDASTGATIDEAEIEGVDVQSDAGTNLLINGTFEDGMTAWNDSNGDGVEQVIDGGGNFILQVGDPAAWSWMQQNPQGWVPGEKYIIKASSHVSGGAIPVTVGVMGDGFDVSMAFDSLTPETKFTGLTVPIDTTWLGVYVGMGTGSGLGYVDDVRLIEQPSCSDPATDMDGDGDVDLSDYGAFQRCYSGAEHVFLDCWCVDLNGDEVVDLDDFGVFQACMSGPNTPADPACDD
jgi:mannan endo-1,4-beta-mannosidase